nr:hypothetical protein [Microbispora cellulosiformans]
MARNLILSGGVAHDLPATSAALADVLAHLARGGGLLQRSARWALGR